MQSNRQVTWFQAAVWSDHVAGELVRTDFAVALGARLRAVRQQQGLSMYGLQAKSRGRWKAVVVGSYERGDRAVSMSTLAELAAFYNVPVADLVPGQPPSSTAEPTPRLTIDLTRLYWDLNADATAPLIRYVATVQSQRGDYNGKVLSLRQDDLRALAVIYNQPLSTLIDTFISWGVLNPEARGLA